MTERTLESLSLDFSCLSALLLSVRVCQAFGHMLPEHAERAVAFFKMGC